MYKRIILIIITVLFSAALNAQAYKNAIGIRAGFSSGLNYRYLTDHSLVIEGMGLFNRTGFHFSALAE